jgi:Excalibur calcium-binding domain
MPEQVQAKAIGIGNGQCAGKHYCNEMIFCEEAKFYLTQCGLSRLDGDGDGVPCDALCRCPGERDIKVTLHHVAGDWTMRHGYEVGYQAKNDRADGQGRARSALHIGFALGPLSGPLLFRSLSAPRTSAITGWWAPCLSSPPRRHGAERPSRAQRSRAAE